MDLNAAIEFQPPEICRFRKGLIIDFLSAFRTLRVPDQRRHIASPDRAERKLDFF